jgi:argininosuccinate lyase
MTVWAHRFADQTSDLLRRHGDSFPFDQRLLPEELQASVAHARALGTCGAISKGDARKLIEGLRELEHEAESGVLDFSGDHEDVHSFVESELARHVGELAGKLHTGRSRNDQVATVYRLWLRGRIDGDLVAIDDLLHALLDQAEGAGSALLPAYTHLQRAQAVLLAHHILAHIEALLRDRERLLQARKRLNVLPLGAGAGTGIGFPIDRRTVAKELGFAAVTRNSLDAVSDRDFLLDYLSAGAVLGAHLSRLAEEVILFTSAEFSFARLSDRASTGSSIMPQKRNPDGAELVRGRSGRLTGHLMAMLTTLKGLPLSYNKDLQEGGGAILDAASTVRAVLELMTLTMTELRFDTDRMEAALSGGFAEATEAADWLVKEGVPFREAHGIVAGLVRVAEEQGLGDLGGLTDEVLKAAHPRLGPKLRKHLDPLHAAQAKDVIGGTAPRRVKVELKRIRRLISRD